MRILVIGASGGIGAALAEAARVRGDQVTALARTTDGLDLRDEASVAATLGALEGVFDRILVATGALEIDGRGPEKSLRGLSALALTQQFALNAVGPALVLKHAVGLLPRDRPAVFAALSARVGSIGDNRAGGWYSYRAAKAALNQLIHTGAIELARTHPHLACVTLHPGTVLTPLTAAYAGRHPTVTADAAAANLWRVIEGLTATETGGFFDWTGARVPW
ncbi:SDR family NAD(P)-dependent oxidoreductase [Pararhodobacter sp.]|uniref:SDR family NAD(P)-dependent oxidoreductase n=1 Tax=Pararhodobacter sp. TaxID=2127056 RepID=UPI002AFFDB8A|nr:SDR family NAD(P)-dependent oxidoreductase [Pararhodobacter sp.]